MKENLQLRLIPGITREERLWVSNSIRSVVEDNNLVISDAIGFVEDMKTNMRIVDFFSACTSIICFVLGMF